MLRPDAPLLTSFFASRKGVENVEVEEYVFYGRRGCQDPLPKGGFALSEPCQRGVARIAVEKGKRGRAVFALAWALFTVEGAGSGEISLFHAA